MYSHLTFAALVAVAASPGLAIPWGWGNHGTSTAGPPVVTTSYVPVPEPSTGGGGGGGGGESHLVTLINNCGQGTAVLQDGRGQVYEGTTTYPGRLEAGLAWIKGAYGCGPKDGANCGDVEFTLTNSGQSSINYSLQSNGAQTHTYKYPMHFTTSDCSFLPYVPGQCAGDDQTTCPGAFLGLDTTGGTVFSCTDVPNMALTITFC